MFTNPRFSKIMKFACAGALLLMIFWLASPLVQLLLEMLICVGAITVAMEAISKPKYIWAAGFASIAVTFNPAIPVTLSRKVFVWVDMVCIVAFLLSVAALKRRPVLSIPSITDRTPGSESL